MSAVARRHGLTPGQLFAWRREARRARAMVSSGFIPVMSETLSPSPKKGGAREKSSPEVAVAASALMEVAVGDAVIRVFPGADERTIAAVLSAIKLVR